MPLLLSLQDVLVLNDIDMGQLGLGDPSSSLVVEEALQACPFEHCR
jgi:hypothetical protein